MLVHRGTRRQVGVPTHRMLLLAEAREHVRAAARLIERWTVLRHRLIGVSLELADALTAEIVRSRRERP